MTAERVDEIRFEVQDNVALSSELLAFFVEHLDAWNCNSEHSLVSLHTI